MSDNTHLDSFVYTHNSLHDELTEKDPKARSEFRFEGKITKDNYQDLKKLLDWAKESEEVYRKIEIIVVDNTKQKKAIRRFKFDEVFCIDYSEEFGIPAKGTENESKMRFKLFMAQSPTGKKHDVTYEEDDD